MYIACQVRFVKRTVGIVGPRIYQLGLISTASRPRPCYGRTCSERKRVPDHTSGLTKPPNTQDWNPSSSAQSPVGMNTAPRGVIFDQSLRSALATLSGWMPKRLLLCVCVVRH